MPRVGLANRHGGIFTPLILSCMLGFLLLSVPPAPIAVGEVPADDVIYSAPGQFSVPAGHIPHGAIEIDDDGDFAAQDWPGEGSEGNPYRIENLLIDLEGASGSCISINDTTAYFTIKNCTLTGASTDEGAGIYLNNVDNGRIEDCDIDYSYYGIYMEDVDSVIVENVDILQCETGAGLVGSSHVVVTDSYIGLNDEGVHILNCEECEVSENSITLNDLDGVLVESSGNIVIEDNTFNNNDGPAFHFVNSNDGEAGNNRVLDHIDGIYIESGFRNSVHDSWIPNVGDVAIMIGSGASDTSLNWNNILDLQHDMVDDGVNSSISYNYWANYSGADADSNGIGDTPYPLAGSAGNSDPYPLVYYARAPMFDPLPENQTIDYGSAFSYDLNATSDSPLAEWSIDDTTHFSIDAEGVIANIVALQPGDYSIEVAVENLYNYTASATFIVTVTGTGGAGTQTMLLLVAGALGAILVVGVVVVFMRRR